MSKKVEKKNNGWNKKKAEIENFSSVKPHKSKKTEEVSKPKPEKDQEVSQLKETITKLEKEKESLLRLSANLDNQQKELKKEIERERKIMEEKIKYSNEKLINQLLFLPDNYEQAMKVAQQTGQENPKQELEKELKNLKDQLQKETDSSKRVELEKWKEKIEQWIQNLEVVQKKIDNLLKGLQMILQWFQNFLKKQSVEEIEVIPGKDTFDGNLHESLEESSDSEETILQVLRKGYKIYGRVLRPAIVKIGKAKENE